MGKPVIHWEIGGNGTKKLENFYSKLFNWKIDANNPMNYGIANTGGEGAIGPTAEDKKRCVTFYRQASSLRNEYSNTIKKGRKK